jgi:hypothetical protein
MPAAATNLSFCSTKSHGILWLTLLTPDAAQAIMGAR